MQEGIEKSRLSTNISLYLENDTRYSHSYYGWRMGNRTQAFDVPFPMTLSTSQNKKAGLLISPDAEDKFLCEVLLFVNEGSENKNWGC